MESRWLKISVDKYGKNCWGEKILIIFRDNVILSKTLIHYSEKQNKCLNSQYPFKVVIKNYVILSLRNLI
jgi:hypothetical protein